MSGTYSPFRHLGAVVRKRSPVQLTVFLTRRCNARCPFCFYLSRDRGGENRGPELSLEEMDKMASSLGNLLWLAFSGGEIFLREDLVEAVQIFYQRNRPAVILLPTNGQLPEVIAAQTEAILAKCPRSVVTVKLSIDGPEPLHDRLRGVDGAFRRTMQSYSLLKELLPRHENFELGVNTVFCAANQDCQEEIAAQVKGLEGIRTHTVSLVRGKVDDPSLKEVDLGKYQRTVAKMEARLKNGAGRYRFRGARIKTAQDILQRRLIHRTRMEQKQLIPCYAGLLTLVVTETGDVYPCESFSNKLGNVRQDGYDLVRIIRSPLAAPVLAAIRKRECHCSHECYMMMNILFNWRIYPELLKEYWSIDPKEN
ncbi:MAG: radical SAM/SPASM domain-containing protein [Desulfobulbaceae bacterium]